jgi:hypothetical protein
MVRKVISVPKIGLAGILVLFLLGACSPERKLARKYVKNHYGNGIMIVPLYELIKDNLTITYDTNIRYTAEQIDSVAWSQSCYIQHVSDSVILTGFTNSMINELSRIGYDVYLDETSDLYFSLPDPKWIVLLAQLQLDEEYGIKYQQKFSVENNSIFYEDFRVNQINLSSWLEVSRTNSANKQILFLEGYIQDDYHTGIDIDLMTGNVGILGNRDSLQIQDVYDMAKSSGQKHAELLFDYFMNDFIRENLPTDIINREYFHYDFNTKTLKKGLNESFDVVN